MTLIMWHAFANILVHTTESPEQDQKASNTTLQQCIYGMLINKCFYSQTPNNRHPS